MAKKSGKKSKAKETARKERGTQKPAKAQESGGS